MANPRGQQRDKPFREALRLEIAAAGDNYKGLRKVARSLLNAAADGDVSAIREVADRIDGKIPQAIATIDEHENLVPVPVINVTLSKSPPALETVARISDNRD